MSVVGAKKGMWERITGWFSKLDPRAPKKIEEYESDLDKIEKEEEKLDRKIARESVGAFAGIRRDISLYDQEGEFLTELERLSTERHEMMQRLQDLAGKAFKESRQALQNSEKEHGEVLKKFKNNWLNKALRRGSIRRLEEQVKRTKERLRRFETEPRMIIAMQNKEIDAIKHALDAAKELRRLYKKELSAERRALRKEKLVLTLTQIEERDEEREGREATAAESLS